MTVLDFALIALAVLVIVNALATVLVVCDRYSEPKQKVFQLLALWLVPVIGAILVFGIHRKPESPSGKYVEPNDPQWEDAPTRFVGRAVNSLEDGDHSGPSEDAGHH